MNETISHNYEKIAYIILGIIACVIIAGEIAEFAGELYKKWFL